MKKILLLLGVLLFVATPVAFGGATVLKTGTTTNDNTHGGFTVQYLLDALGNPTVGTVTSTLGVPPIQPWMTPTGNSGTTIAGNFSFFFDSRAEINQITGAAVSANTKLTPSNTLGLGVADAPGGNFIATTVGGVAEGLIVSLDTTNLSPLITMKLIEVTLNRGLNVPGNDDGAVISRLAGNATSGAVAFVAGQQALTIDTSALNITQVGGQGMTEIATMYEPMMGVHGHKVQLLKFEFTEIPEPATLAVLGLGGLLMARRRR